MKKPRAWKSEVNRDLVNILCIIALDFKGALTSVYQSYNAYSLTCSSEVGQYVFDL